MMNYIAWFDEIGKEDVKIAGGKGANLGEMYKKFPIPPGYIITSRAYFYFIKHTGIQRELEKLLSNLDVEDTDKLQETSNKIKQLFMSKRMLPELEVEIKNGFKKLRGEDYGMHVAVRSSATAEDLPDASFAGQQATFLGVDENNLINAVLKCWASLFTSRAIYYRAKKGFDHMKVGIAVVVQKLIDADVAGVAFTAHPTTGENKVVVEAAYGLGEAVVSGMLTPDTYIVDPNTWKIEKHIVKQDFKIVRKGNRTEKVPVDENKGKMQKLSDEKIIELAKICKRIENHYGRPQDIEWAYKNKLYIVQARAITTIKSTSKQAKEQIQSVQKEENSIEQVVLEGLGASPGIAFGKVVKVASAKELDKVKDGDVLVTKMTSPDMVPAMKKAVAIITDEGGMTSHAAIVSRELGIPCVVGTEKATQTLKEGMWVTVDGELGKVYQGKHEEAIKKGEIKEQVAEIARNVIVTGTKVYVNLSEPTAAKRVAKRYVDGVGLLRAEFIAAQIGEHPKYAINQGRGKEWSNKLAEGLEEVARAFYPRPVVYRTLDFKTNEYKSLKGGEIEPKEENPMIGYRGCYRNIRDVDVFKLELDAIKQVRSKGLKNVYVMLPFVRTEWELKEALEIMAENGLKRGRDFKVWIMAEVPSAVIMIDQLIKHVDGVSIGTNDLTQLTLGADRDNGNLSEIFDERDPAVLRSIERVITECRKQGKTISVCGQAPSVYNEFVEFLVEKGVTSVSVNPDVIEKTRRLVASAERRVLLEKIRNG